MDRYKESFREEALEVIGEIEKCLLLLEVTPEDPALIQQVFRAMHTLKGNSSMFGFKVIAEFTHHLESVYEYVRSGKKKITKEILDVTLASLDHLSYLIENDSILDAARLKTHNKFTSGVVNIVHAIEKELNIESYEPVSQVSDERDTNLKNYHIFFAPHNDISYNGTNPLHLIEELQTFGDCLIVSNQDNIPSLQEIEPTYCYTSWQIYLTTEAELETIKGVFVFVEGRCRLEITMVNTVVNSYSSVEGNIAEKKDEEESDSYKGSSVNEESLSVKKHAISSIRVPSGRLDNLMSLVSELMTLQAKLATLTEQNPIPELHAVTENLEKLSTSLRDNAFSMCLIPVENMVTPFHRLVRDLAADLNKEIEFITEGTETELDKNIIEGLSDPLMHLLRNSIDHGIEEPEIRTQSGKSRYGKIVFKAYCAGTNVFIEIKDDGKGMDPEKIRSKAIQKGIISKDDVLSEKELFNLIFLPGFSTAEQVSETSGRGVGMDVVKRKLSDIRGQIRISSELNKGTAITIKLPITVSIIDGLLVKINGDDFVIPLPAIDKCFEIASAGSLNKFSNLIVLDGEQIPFISLREEFGMDEDLTISQELVIVNYDEKRIGLLVDTIKGKFQAVLKPLGRYYQNMDNISGATILGDGKIALVLDTSKVIELFLNKKSTLICQ